MRYRQKPVMRPVTRAVGGFGYSGMPGSNTRGQPSQTANIPGTANVAGMGGRTLVLDANDPRVADMSLAQRAQVLGFQDYIPQTGIEDNQGDPYALQPDVSAAMRTPMDPGIDTPGYENPYRTVMYSVTGLSTSIPMRVLTGNLRRTYLIVQNLGPGNLFLGIGTDPNAGGQNVMNLVATQIYEQIGGGFYLPPNPWYPDGVSIGNCFVSSEYISLMTDTGGTNAMILEGTWSPPRPGAQARGS